MFLSSSVFLESAVILAVLTAVVIDNNTGSSSVRALFSNPDGVLRSGATGQIIIPSPMDSVLVIPQKATFELQDRRFVYVVNDSNKVVSTPIAIETNNDGKVFVVTSGLKAGDRVAIEGVGTKLKDGMTINPTAAAPALDLMAASREPLPLPESARRSFSVSEK